MLDIKYVRENLDEVEEILKHRNCKFDKNKFFELEKQRRDLIATEEELQSKRNKTSKQIGALMSQGKKDEAEKAKEEVRAINEKLEKAKEERELADKQLKEFMMSIPNIAHDTTPVGSDENDNVEVRKWGEPKQFSFDAKPHWDIGTDLKIIDFERGVKLAKSRFYVLGGAGAKLERALINFMIDFHEKNGYKE